MPDTAVEPPLLMVARVVQALRGEMHTHTWWHSVDFASTAAEQLLAARPDPAEGERAAGVRDGLEAAARIVLALARVPEEDRGSALEGIEEEADG